MRYAIVNNANFVENIAISDTPISECWIETEYAGIGWSYSDGVFSQPEIPQESSVPQTISMRQARLSLYGAGLLDAVEAAVAQATKAVQIEWEFAAELDRSWPTLILLAGALGLTDAQVDGLFVQAASL